MLISKKLTSPTIGLVVLCFLIPFLANSHVSLMDGFVVLSIENIQALMLLSFAVYSYYYMRPLDCPEGKKQFWLWAVFWWILLFGRSISWGRDFFPDVPHIYFRILSIFFIAPVVLMLFSKKLREEIALKFKTISFPIFSFLLAVIGLIISDAVEHSRMIAPLFLHDLAYKDLIEEMYEFPVIWGLFEVSYLLMKQDKKFVKQAILVPQEAESDELSDYKNAH